MRGDLRPPAGQAPLPPFEKWAFRRRHYVQYLVDLMAVHRALEDATTAALHTPPPEDQEDAQQTGPLPPSFATPLASASLPLKASISCSTRLLQCDKEDELMRGPRGVR